MLAFILPAGIISAIILRPKAAVNPVVENSKPVIGRIITSEENELLSVILSKNDSLHLYQLQFQIKQPLAVPSVLVYREKGNKQDELLGTISGSGTTSLFFREDSTEMLFNFRLYDGIHAQGIDTIYLKP